MWIIHKHTCTDKIPASAITKVMKYSVAVILKHLSMNVEARVAKFCDFLGKKFHPIHRIAENNRLVYLKLKTKIIVLSNQRWQNKFTICIEQGPPDNYVVIVNLREKSVEAVNFLPFFNKSIKLGYTLEGKLIHKVDDVGLSQKSIFEIFYCHRKCS